MAFATQPSAVFILRLALFFWLAIALIPRAMAEPAPSNDKDHITQRAWVEDASGQLALPEVRNRPAQTFEGVLSKGFGTSVIWLRLRIDPRVSTPSAREPAQLILRIRPAYLDDIRIYDPLLADGLAGVTGDLHHPRDQSFVGQDFLLPIARGEVPRDIWLRLASTSTRQLAVQALRYEDLQRQAHTQQLIFALYIGVILIFMVWGLVYWRFSRETVIGAFSLKQLAALLYALTSLGYARLYWPAAWSAQGLDLTSSVLSCAAVTAAIYFHAVLLREVGLPTWLRRLHQVFLLLLPLKLVLIAFGMTITALRINMVEVLLAPVVFLVSAWLAHGWRVGTPNTRPLLPRWAVLGFYGLLLAIMLLASLPGLGLAQGGEIPLYVVQAHGLFTAFLVLLMLQYRAHVQQKRQGETALQLERTQMQVQQERSIREEHEKLLAMLAHELRTPLSTMEMRLDPHAPGTQQVRGAIRDMVAVIERCVQTIQLDDRQLRARLAAVDLSKLVRDAIAASRQPRRLQTRLPNSLTLQTDPQLLAIVLQNLIENACKYAAPDSPITLHLEQSDETLRLRICNLPGPAGWPEADKVFAKYYRGPHARRQAGTGLGLYLVHNVAQVLGGQLTYSPTTEQVCFELSLPRHHASDGLAAQP